MTRSVAVLAYDLAVAVISIGLFIGTLVSLATHEISSFHGIFLLIGAALAATTAVLKFQQDREPWLITIFGPNEMPTQKSQRPAIADMVRFWNWPGRAQRS